MAFATMDGLRSSLPMAAGWRGAVDDEDEEEDEDEEDDVVVDVSGCGDGCGGCGGCGRDGGGCTARAPAAFCDVAMN